MELKTLQAELQRLSLLVNGWQHADEITTIERELVLARLRDLYEAVRFGLESQPDVEPVAPFAALPAEEPAPVEEEPIESEPFALEGEDFFSLDAISPVEEFAASEEETMGEPEIEEIPMVEESATEEVVEPIAEEEPIAVPEEKPEIEPEPIVEEPKAEPEPIVTPEPEKPVEKSAPNPFATLFGDEPAEDRHRRKQRVIMSLYDAPEEEEKSPAPIVEPEPEPMVEERAAIEREPAEESTEQVDSLILPVEEDAYPEEVIEISEEELEESAEEVVEELVEEEILEEKVAEETIDEEPVEEENPAELPTIEQPTIEEPTVLGEVIRPQQTLGDQLAARQTVNDLRPRVTDLRRAVGLNDKFLLIRDLFGGNGSLYEITIRKLNEFDNFDDCMIYIAEHFAWNPNSDGAKLMLELLERKFEEQ